MTGTVCDAGVFAPVLSFQKMFENEGVPITDAEARGPMGVHKRVSLLRTFKKHEKRAKFRIRTEAIAAVFFQTHIQTILEYPAVSQRWISKRGSPHTDEDVDRIYKNYLAGTMDTLVSNSKIIDGK